MDRIINLKVVGNNITKDNDYAGVRGEANATKLKITFDESWSGFSKNVYFWDAHGENLVSIILTSVYWVDSNENIVLVPIPSEPLAVAGEMTIVIEGSKDGVKQVSATCNLKVLDSPENRDVINSPPPTDTELKQLQDGLTDLASKVSEYVEVSEKIDGMTVEGRAIGANQSAAVAKSINEDGGYHLIFGIPRGLQGVKGETGATGPQGPAGRDGKAPYIKENGNWFEWDANLEQYEDTGVKAQGPKGEKGDTGPQGPQGEQGKEGASGLPNIRHVFQEFFSAEATNPLPAYTEVQIIDAVNTTIMIGEFKRNTAKPGYDMWALKFTADEGITVQESQINARIEWAVADPVFTAGYIYYLMFIPLKDESEEFGEYYKGTLLGVWVAKELRGLE